MHQQKVWLVTGAGKRFGLEIVKAVLASGDRVVATVRNEPEKAKGIFGAHPDVLVVKFAIEGLSKGLAAELALAPAR